jgi:tripartite-type tricarboxylate transporter receptor subunit TctC
MLSDRSTRPEGPQTMKRRYLVAAARPKPGDIVFAAAGQGSSQHMFGETFKLLTGTEMTFLSYKGSAAAIVNRMNAEVEKILATPEVAVKLDNLGLEHAPNTPAQFVEFNRAELVKWAKIVKDGKITLQP